jgi:tripartite-type tricarboxylate transporter receptor subunit TctC
MLRILAFVLGLSIQQAALAQIADYPSRPVRLVIPVPPGGAADLIGRELGRSLAEAWGKPVVIDNKPGASAAIGIEAVAKAPPDGLTLLLAGGFVGNVAGYERLSPDSPLLESKVHALLVQLTPIAEVAGISYVLVASPSLNVKTLSEFVSLAKSKPGALDYGSAGIGLTHHLAMELFQHATGTVLNHIPYKGGAPALQDVVAGRVSVMWSPISTAMPLLQANKLVPLAVGTIDRTPLLPAMPTVAELGYPSFEAANWFGILGPGGVRNDLVQKIQRDIERVVKSPAYGQRLQQIGNEVRYAGADALGRRLRAEYETNLKLSRRTGAAPN